VPPLGGEPESSRIVRAARTQGRFPTPDATGDPLWTGAFQTRVPIDPDRDLNGVGLLYFANYVAFLDAAERRALQEAAGMDAAALNGRVTVRRRIAYFGNAEPADQLDVEVEALRLAGPHAGHLLVHHRVRRASDGRLIAVAMAERQLRAGLRPLRDELE
jgi:probable biosynthetic protein (TIGR04098 family)